MCAQGQLDNTTVRVGRPEDIQGGISGSLKTSSLLDIFAVAHAHNILNSHISFGDIGCGYGV
jgi:hypothetical protein